MSGCQSAGRLAIAPTLLVAGSYDGLRGGQSKSAIRVYGMGVYMDGVGIRMNNGNQIKDPVLAALEDFAIKWSELREALALEGGAMAEGVAAEHPNDARQEAAQKLIRNHEMVLRDLTSPLRPRSQPELVRVPMIDAQFADQALREVARRLLGRREGSVVVEERPEPSTAGHADAWILTAEYLSARIQVTSVECPSRAPDMSEAAADALRAVLHEVGDVARELLEGRNDQQQ